MHRVLITSSVLLYLTTLTICQLTFNDLQSFSENDIFNGENIEPVTTTGLTAGLTCSTISQCQQLIQQLEQQVQGIESQLIQSTNGEQSPEFTENVKTIKNEFTVPSSGLHYYSQAIPSEGAFYIWAQGAGQDNVGVYLSSTCNCNNNPTYIPATQTRNCQSFTAGASGLTETAPEKCTVFYTVATISPAASVFVWFFPLKSLLRNTIQKIQFPYDDSYRYFTETIEAKDLPVTFYLRSFGGNPSISTQVFATVDCLDSCVQTSYFTHFPTSGSNCYSSVTSGTESYLSITLTQTCNIYYSIYSSKEGVSAQLGTYVYQTLPVKNNDLTTVYYPIPNTYRTFYQDLGPYSIFYVTTYGLGQGANSNVPVYVTTNCTGSCVNSADYTDFPTSEQSCWQYTFNAQFKSSGGYCRVYYSLFSSYIRDTVRLKTLLYPLKQIPLNTPTPISFPYDNSYRWFYADIDSISSSFGFGTEYFNINTIPTDAGMTPLLYVTHNCTTQCSQSPDFTHFPAKTRNCLSGSTNYALNLNGANVPCRVYYSIYSTNSGTAVNLRTSLSTM